MRSRDNDQDHAAQRSTLVERCLHECGHALYPHLSALCKAELRLVCKASRDAVDSCVEGLTWLPPEEGPPSDHHAGLKACGLRWRYAKRLYSYCLPTIPPALERLELLGFESERFIELYGGTGLPSTLATTLRFLDIDFQSLTHKGAQLLADSLSKLTSLQDLSLAASCAGECAAVAALSQGLHTLTQLTHLHLLLSSCQSCSAQWPAVAQATGTLTQLQVLHLDVPLGRSGCEALARSLPNIPVRQLRLVSCGLASEGIEQTGLSVLAPALASATLLTHLVIHRDNLASQGTVLAGILQHLLQLKGLSLVLVHLSDSDGVQVATALPHLTCLEELSLKENLLADEAAAALARCLQQLTNLRALDLEGNCMLGQIPNPGTEALLSTIKHLTNLTTLDLGWNPLGLLRNHGRPSTAIAQTVSCLTGLRSLRLQRAMLDDDCAFTLASPLQSLHYLTDLQLGENAWGLAGMALLLMSVGRMTDLQTLAVTTYSHITPFDLRRLTPLACSQLRGLGSLRYLRMGSADEGVIDVKADPQDHDAVLEALPQLLRLEF